MTSRRSVPRQMRRPAPRGGVTARQQVLARRKYALILLGIAVPATLVAALVTGSTTLLYLNLFFDVVIAGYIAMLLQIKQGQGNGVRQQWMAPSDEEVRIL